MGPLSLNKVWQGRLQELEAGAHIAPSQEADREDADAALRVLFTVGQTSREHPACVQMTLLFR